MKVLLINGSPKANGNTSIALNEMVKVFHEEGVETEIAHVGNKDARLRVLLSLQGTWKVHIR